MTLDLVKQDNLYLSKIDLGNFTIDPFGILEPLPEKEINCNYIFCKDIDLQKRINSELKAGRLIIITHAGAGFLAAAIETDSSPIQTLLKDIGKDQLANKSILAITPATTMDTLHHELFHAEDHLNPELRKLINELEYLITGGNINCNLNLNRIARSYVMEMRAYNGESIEEISSKSYSKETLQSVLIKKEYYEKRLDRAFSGSVLTEDQVDNIKSIIKVVIELNNSLKD
jgi:hypothetical protein